MFRFARPHVCACMLAMLAASAGSAAFAQTTGSIRPDAPAAELPSPGNPDGLATGGPDLDEKTARQMLDDAGYRDITVLMKDAQGIWRGTAHKDSQKLTIALDRRGKIVAH